MTPIERLLIIISKCRVPEWNEGIFVTFLRQSACADPERRSNFDNFFSLMTGGRIEKLL